MIQRLILSLALTAFGLCLSLFSSGQKLVLPGDHPDPSVVKIGDAYWASATTSNWFPAFSLLKSKDLVQWKTTGYVFDTMPAWADFYFWAPEVSYENGKVYVYYAAHKKDGNLCIAVASADKPEGPYKDHGPLMCQEVGSIDAFPMRDENGKLYMIWKEDANSVKKPTPMWAQQMNEERTKLIGEKKELFRNNVPWEKNLVEGASMIKHGEYYYAFYAAAGCCGSGCDYVTGVARSKNLLGPWEKYNNNPVLKNNDNWICPGHGTPVEKDGKFYFLYHGYDKQTNAFTGREGLLAEFKFTADNWIEFVNEPTQYGNKKTTFNDKFKGRTLDKSWQWSVFQKPVKNVAKGALHLNALPVTSGAFIGQKTMSGDYQATTVINTNKTTASAGVAAIGDQENIITIFYSKGKVVLVQVKRGKEAELASTPVDAGKKLYLRMQAREGKLFSFSYSTNGKHYVLLNKEPLNGTFLPPWDRAVRVGLVAKGVSEQVGVFDSFRLENEHSE
jgi:xylan 1,4-beta-xylosidase